MLGSSGRLGLLAVVLVIAVGLGGVWLGRGSGEPHDPGCDGEPEGPSALVGFDADAGAGRWNTTVGRVISAAIVDDVVVTRAAVGVLRAHDIDTGERRWCFVVASPDPVGEVFVGMAGTLAGIVALVQEGDIVGYDADGQERWRTRSPFANVWLGGGEHVWVYDGADARHRSYVVLDPATGAAIADPPEPLPLHPLRYFGLDATPQGAAGLHVVWSPNDASPEHDIAVSVRGSAGELWRANIAGEFAALVDSSAGAVLVVSDFSGGSGDPGALDFSLTGYDAVDGARLWTRGDLHHPVMQIVPLDHAHLVVPLADVLLAIDPATGATQWESDLGSPGTGGRFEWPGRYSYVGVGPSGAAVGVITAVEPSRGD